MRNRLWRFIKGCSAAASFGAVMASTPALADGSNDVKTFMFANSLVHHLSDTDETAVPHWLGFLAKADGKRFAVDGQWGFLRNFAETLPPVPNWSFKSVRGAWNSDRTSFGKAGFDSVIFNTANFIQYQPANAPYEGDNPTKTSPLEAAETLVKWVKEQSPTTRIFMYEGWAEMSGFSRKFPPSNRGLKKYHAANQGAYHDWYVSFAADLNNAVPDANVTLIPVASVLSELLTSSGLKDIPATDLYSDDAPHGTPSLYFLAAMITYPALFDAPLPETLDIPDTVHPDIIAAYPDLATQIWAIHQQIHQDAAMKIDNIRYVQAQSKADGVQDPALAMGLNGIADWSTQHPFLNVMKTARPWIGHKADQWGGWDEKQLAQGGFLDREGWPTGLPEDVDRLEAFILTDQPTGAEHLRGTYVLRYQGKGTIKLAGRAKRVDYTQPGVIRFRYEPGDGLVAIAIHATDRDDPIHSITIVREDLDPLFQVGEVFNPDWIDRIKDLRAIRFMDWMFTNGSSIATWDQRPKSTDYTYVWRGVPLSVMVDLSNKIGADAWFNMPHMADDDYIRNFATVVRATLDPRLMAYAEYSNEVWNAIFPQAGWAREQAQSIWGDAAGDDSWMQFYGMRAAQVAEIWKAVYAKDADQRLKTVVAVHTGWPGLEEPMLYAPLYVAMDADNKVPEGVFDTYAVSGYFGYDMGQGDGVTRLKSWLAEAQSIATQEGEAQGLRRVALREFVKTRKYAPAFDAVETALRQGSLTELTQELWPYHAKIARESGLELIMYEGGSHVAGVGETVQDDDLTEFYKAFNYSPNMASLYDTLLQEWRALGGTLFNAFVDVAPASQWGSWGALRHLNDASPRWDVLQNYNAVAGGWRDRADETFLQGRTVLGDASDNRFEGTSEEDSFAGGAGNDLFISAGGNDRFHGGTGQDRVILPGSVADYTIFREDELIVVIGKTTSASMLSIEQVQFTDQPDEWSDLDQLAG